MHSRVAASLLVLLFSSFVHAEEPALRIIRDQVRKDGKSTDRIHVAPRPDRENKLYVTAEFRITQGEGDSARDVLNIVPEEIVVKEDGKVVADVEILTPAATQPLTTVLAIDISGSMAEHGKMEEAKQAARTFLENLHPEVQCGLILFDHELRARLTPTTDRDALRRLIDTAEPRGGTAYLDATAEALSMLSGTQGRRAVLLLTDGVDLNSNRSLKDAVHLARSAEVPVYTIGVGEPGKNTPVTTVLVLDCSGSMDERADDSDTTSKMEALHRAAGRFVDIMRPGSQTTLLPFSTNVFKPQPFSADKASLKAKIKSLEAGGETALFNATYTAVQLLVRGNPPGKRAVVVLTDGKDNRNPNGGEQRAIALARQAEIPLHMLGLGRPEEVDERAMRSLAESTGGTYHHARNELKLIEFFEKLSIELHDDGIDEAALTKLADETGGKYYAARDITQLRFIYQGLADELQRTYRVSFPSLRQTYDGTSRDIDILVLRNGRQVSDVFHQGYNVSGVIEAATDARVYLWLLAVLAGLLVLPSILRTFSRRAV